MILISFDTLGKQKCNLVPIEKGSECAVIRESADKGFRSLETSASAFTASQVKPGSGDDGEIV